MVDDAHASGVFGTKWPRHDRSLRHARPRRHPGRNAVEGDRCAGGYVAGCRGVDRISVSPGAAVPVLNVPSTRRRRRLPGGDRRARNEPQLIERLWDNTRFFKSGLQTLGFDTGASESPITPVIVGDAALAMNLSDALFENGVFAQGIGFPTVPRGKARVRTIVTATHTRDELQFALDAFAKVGRSLGVI